MTSNLHSWNPTDGNSWAEALGLVHVALLPPTLRGESGFGQCAALLDGPESSFSLFSLKDGSETLPRRSRTVSLSWSAYLRHVVMLDEVKGAMLLGRWDAEPNQYVHHPLPRGATEAEALLHEMQKAPPARPADAITFALRAFRQLRDMLPGRPALDAIRIFNGLLVGMEAVRRGGLEETKWTRSRTVDEALKALRDLDCDIEADTEIADLSQSSRDSGLGDLLERFLAEEPTTGFRLDPGLLLRHAAGQLYQEAHIQIARDDRLPLPGMGREQKLRGDTKRDIHFTPVPLARALVEQALDALPEDYTSRKHLRMLDPACGSGVFLQEAVRELQQRGYTGQVLLRGIDISPVSCAMARFCLGRAREDAKHAGIDVKVVVDEADALRSEIDWGAPDVILMNPPFAYWDAMPAEERAVVAEVMTEIGKRGDKASAFTWRGLKLLGRGGVLASVLPAPVFETQTGEDWREGLMSLADVRLLGRFQGIGYFKSSAVEPGFVVLQQRDQHAAPGRQRVRILVAEEGAEDTSIRWLRKSKNMEVSGEGQRWDVYDTDSLSASSWLPRSRRAVRLSRELRMIGVPRVEKSFRVVQGALTGNNEVFLLSDSELQRLPEGEHRFFRQSAGTRAIRNGRLFATEHVFYPYDGRDLTLTSEEDLDHLVPEFYHSRLRPAKAQLKARRGLTGKWWELNRPRKDEHVPRPKLVSKYFGGAGGFAFDEVGNYVVVQGHLWLWTGRDEAAPAKHRTAVGFPDPQLAWAYLALLNSSLFETVLSCFCPRVRGGQLNLSTRFVGQALLPDLTGIDAAAEVIAELACLGRQIHEGRMPEASALSEAAARAYGIGATKVTQLTGA